MWIDEDSEFANIAPMLDKDKDVLEVGCGNGRISERLSKVARTFVGVDPDKSKLDEAINILGDDSGTTFKVARGEALPFSEESFDIVFYYLSFHHLPIKLQYDGILEAKRVLRKDGRLLIYEPIAAGQMQSLFLIFEPEINELKEVYVSINRAVDNKAFDVMRRKNFSINWRFDDVQDLFRFFQGEYGKDALEKNEEKVLSLLKDKARQEPIILEDKLILFELRACK
jgi:SAM-dependent methyltransferase